MGLVYLLLHSYLQRGRVHLLNHFSTEGSTLMILKLLGLMREPLVLRERVAKMALMWVILIDYWKEEEQIVKVSPHYFHVRSILELGIHFNFLMAIEVVGVQMAIKVMGVKIIAVVMVVAIMVVLLQALPVEVVVVYLVKAEVEVLKVEVEVVLVPPTSRPLHLEEASKPIEEDW